MGKEGRKEGEVRKRKMKDGRKSWKGWPGRGRYQRYILVLSTDRSFSIYNLGKRGRKNWGLMEGNEHSRWSMLREGERKGGRDGREEGMEWKGKEGGGGDKARLTETDRDKKKDRENWDGGNDRVLLSIHSDFGWC
jgi:hypothetical protein